MTRSRSIRRKQEQAKRARRLTEAQAVLGWSVILLLGALLGAIYLNQASRIATVGRRVQSLQEQLDDLKRENAVLERQIAEVQSLDRLQQEALRLGFVQARPDEIDYIIIPDYPVTDASAADGAAVLATPAPPPDTVGEMLAILLQDSIDRMIHGEASEQ